MRGLFANSHAGSVFSSPGRAAGMRWWARPKATIGVVVFGGEFEEFDKVGGECESGVVAAEAVAGLAEACFAEGMEFAFRAAREGDFAVEEEIEHTCEGALWA